MVTDGYRWLRIVIECYQWLWMVIECYRWLRMVIECYRWLRMVIECYQWLWMVIECYQWLRMVVMVQKILSAMPKIHHHFYLHHMVQKEKNTFRDATAWEGGQSSRGYDVLKVRNRPHHAHVDDIHNHITKDVYFIHIHKHLNNSMKQSITTRTQY